MEKRDQTTEWQLRATRVSVLAVVALALAIHPPSAAAHSGPPPAPETLWSTWNVDPLIILVLTIGLWAYIRSVRVIWTRAGRNRGVRYYHAAAGVGGFLVLGVALVSPLDPLSSALFSAHMIQHILLIAVAPLLFIVANVSSVSIWSLPRAWRKLIPRFWRSAGIFQPIWNAIARPLPALMLHSLVLWAWHVPVLYNAAVRSEVIHAIEHISLFLSALLFWWIVIQRGRQPGLNYGIGVLLIFGLVIQKTALGALITFSSSPWYSEYATTTAAWGLTPTQDQELAGAMLIGPGGVVYLIAGVLLFAWWIRAIERSVDRNERLIKGYPYPAEERSGRAKERA